MRTITEKMNDYLVKERKYAEDCIGNDYPCPFCGKQCGHKTNCPYPDICEILDEGQSADPSTLTTTRIDGATYAVPVSVAKGIGRLRTDRDKTLGTVEMLRDRVFAMGEIGEGYRAKLRKCEAELEIERAEVSRLRCELEAARKSGEGLGSDLYKCLATLTRLRGDSQPHASGDECKNCQRLATKAYFPFCDQCHLEALLDFCCFERKAYKERVQELSEAQKGTESVNIAEMMDFLDDLHAGLDHNMYEAAPLLRCAFPELSQRDATIVVMCWMDRWNRERGKET